MELLTSQLKQILRRLGRAPIFTAVTLLTLAVSIGATTTIFSIVESVLLKPLPYPKQEELVSVRLKSDPSKPGGAISPAHYFIFREQNHTLQDIGISILGIKDTGFSVNITGFGEPEHVPALGVSHDLLSTLGVTPFLGRSFTPEDNSPDNPGTVILSYGYWSRKFGGDTSVVGRAIEVDGKPSVIIGVLPEGFRFLDMPGSGLTTNPAVVVPWMLDRQKTYLGFIAWLGIARLKPGVTLAQANADVARINPIVNRSFPPPPGFSLKYFEDMKGAPVLQPLKQDVVGDVGKVLWALMGGISLVLIIACVNLANFHLIRAEGRRQELAIRAALGASRRRIAAELYFESLIIAVVGGLLGLVLAYGALRVLVAIAPQGLPRLHEIGVDGYVVLFAIVVSLAVGLLFGSVAVFKYTGAGLGIVLRAGAHSMSESRERHRSRGVSVIMQVALALVLLVGSGLMIRTFLALIRVNSGFAAPPSEVQTFTIAIRDELVKEPERVVRIQEEMLRKIEAIPGVSSVSLSRSVPMDGNNWSDRVYAKDYDYAPGEVSRARFQFVVPGFFKTLGVPLLAGRDFTWSDNYNKVPVAIVSENFARKYWREPASAVGKQIREKDSGEWREVIGVAGDVRQDGVDKEAPNSVYWPFLMTNFSVWSDVRAQRNVTVAVRSPRVGSEGLMNEIRRAVWSAIPNLPLAEVNTLNYYYTRSMASTSFMLVMLAVAGSMALFLGVVGLYGVIAYSVSQRMREIGIRMALGAGRSAILKMVISQGIKLALIGVAIGLAGALGLTRFLSGLLYGVKPGDPLTLVAVSVLLIAVALLASYIPARQAAKVDPLESLKQE